MIAVIILHFCYVIPGTKFKYTGCFHNLPGKESKAARWGDLADQPAVPYFLSHEFGNISFK